MIVIPVPVITNLKNPKLNQTQTESVINYCQLGLFKYAADCGVPVSNAKLNYSSTLEGSVLILTCENDTFTDKQTLSVTCHSNGSWIPDPADFTCSSFITAPSGTVAIILTAFLRTLFSSALRTVHTLKIQVSL